MEYPTKCVDVANAKSVVIFGKPFARAIAT